MLPGAAVGNWHGALDFAGKHVPGPARCKATHERLGGNVFGITKKGGETEPRSNARLRPEYSAKMVRWALIAVPLVGAATVANSLYLVNQANQPEVDVVQNIGAVTDVQNWGADYMLLWLGGAGPKAGQANSANQQSLRERTSAPFDIALATAPVQVTSVRPNGEPFSVESATGDTYWRVGYEATAKFPGEQASRRLYYELDIVEHDGAYQVTALPRQVTPMAKPFKATTNYTERAQQGSPMWTSADAFAQAYVVPKSGGNLGSTVSANFKDMPLVNSPYQSVETADVVWRPTKGNSVNINAVAPGDTVFALITVKASVSSATYNYMQLPVQMIVMENNQWAVDFMTDFIDVGSIGSPDGGGATEQPPA